jgi:hypothetical protein
MRNQGTRQDACFSTQPLAQIMRGFAKWGFGVGDLSRPAI